MPNALCEVIFQNKRASATLKNAAPIFDWLAVAVDGFGEKNLCLAKNLLAIGDAGAFIDPFTGSGILMALESSEILAQSIAENFLPGEIEEKALAVGMAEKSKEFAATGGEIYHGNLLVGVNHKHH